MSDSCLSAIVDICDEFVESASKSALGAEGIGIITALFKLAEYAAAADISGYIDATDGHKQTMRDGYFLGNLLDSLGRLNSDAAYEYVADLVTREPQFEASFNRYDRYFQGKAETLYTLQHAEKAMALNMLRRKLSR